MSLRMWPAYQIHMTGERVITPELCERIKGIIHGWGADHITSDANEVRFSNDFFTLKRTNLDLMSVIDSGRIGWGSEGHVVFEASLTRITLFALVASIAFGALSKSFLLGLLALCWLGGMNWLITYFRIRYRWKKLKEACGIK